MDSQAEKLNNYLFRSKSKEQDIVNFILETTRDERLTIREKYDETYPGNGLLQDIKKQLGGDFKNLVTKLFQYRSEFDAEQLTNAFKGFSIDEDPIYEIIMTRSSEKLEEIKAYYFNINSRTLEEDVSKYFKNPIKKNLLAMLEKPRSENTSPDQKICKKNAEKLNEIKPDDWLSYDESMNIFCYCSPSELVLTARYYRELNNNKTILTPITSISKSQRKFLRNILFNVINPSELFANKLNESVKGLGTDTKLLERIIVSRYDVDMAYIKQYYFQNFKVTAVEDVKDDTSSYYQQLLIGLMNQYAPSN